MFTKNIKLIGIVALIVVIVMVLSTVIAVNNDKKVAGELGSAVEDISGSVNDAKKDLEKEIAALKDAINSLKGELADAKDVIAKLEEAGVKLENWEAATEVVLEKLAEAKEVYSSYINYSNATETTEATLNFASNYAYLSTNAVEYFKAYLTIAESAIERATSVEEMDAIIAGLKADYDAIPTHYEALYTAFETVEADGVTYDDYDNIKALDKLFKSADVDFFAVAEDEEEKDEIVVLEERLDAIYDEFKPIVIESFVALVAALPEKAEDVRMSHKDAIEAAMNEADFLGDVLTEEDVEELQADEDFVKVVEHYVACIGMYDAVSYVYEAALDLNETLANAVKEGGVLAAGIKADVATREVLEQLYAEVDFWTNVVAADFDLDPESETFDAEVASYYDATILAGYEAALAEAAGDMAKYANEFVTIVNALVITNNSKDDLAAADATYKAFIDAIGNYTPDVVDYILGVEENGVVAAWELLNTKQTVYNDIIAIIDSITELAERVVIACPGHATGVTCDCENVGEIDWTVVAGVDFTTYEADLARLLGNYGLAETVLDADAAAIYKLIRVYEAKQAAIERLGLVYAEGSVDYNRWLGYIEADAKKAYTLEAELDCTCPENSEEECECDVYELVDGAAIVALNGYFPIELQ